MMPRERIKSLKAAISVPEYFRITNHQLQRIGQTFTTLCPFHQEKTPSCFLYEDHFHCYGCGAHGDVIDAFVRMNKTDFKTALDELSRMAGLTQSQPARAPGRTGRLNHTRKEKEQ